MNKLDTAQRSLQYLISFLFFQRCWYLTSFNNYDTLKQWRMRCFFEMYKMHRPLNRSLFHPLSFSFSFFSQIERKQKKKNGTNSVRNNGGITFRRILQEGKSKRVWSFGEIQEVEIVLWLELDRSRFFAKFTTAVILVLQINWSQDVL